MNPNAVPECHPESRPGYDTCLQFLVYRNYRGYIGVIGQLKGCGFIPNNGESNGKENGKSSGNPRSL